jgi:hypothetical protein
MLRDTLTLEKLARLGARRWKCQLMVYGLGGISGLVSVWGLDDRRTAAFRLLWITAVVVFAVLASFLLAACRVQPVSRLRDYFVQHGLFRGGCLAGKPYILVLRAPVHDAGRENGAAAAGSADFPDDARPPLVPELPGCRLGPPGALLVYLSGIEACEQEQALGNSVFVLVKADRHLPEIADRLAAGAGFIICLPEIAGAPAAVLEQLVLRYGEKAAVYLPRRPGVKPGQAGLLDANWPVIRARWQEAGVPLPEHFAGNEGEYFSFPGTPNHKRTAEKPPGELNGANRQHPFIFQELLAEGLIGQDYYGFWRRKFGSDADRAVLRLARECFGAGDEV